jgi:DNA-binding beta-propeller fold protein YncE
MELFRIRVSRVVLCAAIGAALLALASCGNYNNSPANSRRLSKFPSRVFVLNSSGQGFSGFVYILNATNDTVWQTPIGVNNGTNMMVESPDKKSTLLFNPSNNAVTVIDNATEALLTSGTSSVTISLPDATESMAVLSDNKSAVAAVRNAPVSNAPSGAVVVLDLTNNNISATIPVPEVRFVALNNAASKVLAFADNSDSVYLIDATAKTATPIAGFDRPVGAVFSTDDSKAYVLNCGAECGGGAASVQVLDMTNSTLGAKVAVNGATVGLLSGGKLYVAGTAGNSGLLDVVDPATMARTQSGVAITDGYHNLMSMADGGKLFIGAKGCTATNGAGCLSIFGTSGTSAVIPATRAPGVVTGIQPILGRNLVYVTMGGELLIFDTTTDAPRGDRQLDVVGNATAVKLID